MQAFHVSRPLAVVVVKLLFFGRYDNFDVPLPQ
jgi:hypothetical protein